MIPIDKQNFKVIGFSTFRDMTSQKFSFQKGVISILYLSPGIEQNSRKITFYAWKHLSWHKFIPRLHFHGFEAKQKIRMFNFSRGLISKTTVATPLAN